MSYKVYLCGPRRDPNDPLMEFDNYFGHVPVDFNPMTGLSRTHRTVKRPDTSKAWGYTFVWVPRPTGAPDTVRHLANRAGTLTHIADPSSFAPDTADLIGTPEFGALALCGRMGYDHDWLTGAAATRVELAGYAAPPLPVCGQCASILADLERTPT